MTQKTTMSSGSVGAEASSASDPGAAQDIVHDVKQIAGEAAEQAKRIAEGQLVSRKDQAVDTLGRVARALRETGGRLESRNGSGATRYVARAADGIEHVSQYLKSRSLVDVVHDVEGFARREPAIFLGGAFALGLIGSRFLKSSGAPQPGADGPESHDPRRHSKQSSRSVAPDRISGRR